MMQNLFERQEGVPKLNRNRDRNRRYAQVALVAGLMVFGRMALAGTGGEEFDPIWQSLQGWMQGTLGRVVAGAMILVGLVGGVVRQSIMAFATGVGGGVGLYNSPTVIESIMSATIHPALV